MCYKRYIDNSEVTNEFKRLFSETCLFVENWISPEITTSTYRIYGKQFPVNEDFNQFVTTVLSIVSVNSLRKRCATDV